MTRLEAIESNDISSMELVLATDLDGTFLGGTEQDRNAFYQWIEANRHRVGLIFVTGRDPEFIYELTHGTGIPKPDYAIADVGTTIASVGQDNKLSPIRELELEISELWGNANELVKAALREAPGLELQSTDFRYRVSYDLDPEHFDETASDRIKGLGCDVLISDNRFFDVLPRGVSKGPSLLRLLKHLGVAHGRCLAAGDTLNDLSMLELGLPAVAVGGSEQSLLDALSEFDHVHPAQGIGAAGIAEAIEHFQFIKES